jgi:hypothetical protein
MVSTASGGRNASLASMVMNDLTGSSSLLDPIAVGSPEPLSQLVLPPAYVDGSDQPTVLDTLAAAAGLELTAPLGLPVAPAPPPLAATPPDRPTVVNPEPATLLLLGTGLGVAAHYTRRRRPRATRAGPA